ncbi:vitellogenin-like [Macrobrachium rosenbergii]|uniref:vitellogenin-like n=1 Tax=Macrobrachium rosenbergii TaxID=79674 RepID=UPI0034D7B52A
MLALAFFQILSFVICAAAGQTLVHYYPSPWPASVPRCSTECPIAGSPKLAYATGKTYYYSYTGKSHIHLGDAEGAYTDTEWSSQVEVSWLSPCDMAISIKNPSFGASSGSPKPHVLERYPLILAVVDGRVQQACSHPEDDVWSVNMKKGIASAFQNSLPSNSSINTGLNFTETDIIGNCSTLYSVNNEGENVIVEKIKNHRFCQDYYVDRDESPKLWPKFPIPMKESVSECKQEITKGIYLSITCKDRKIIRPAYGSYRYIKASQESILRFQSESGDLPPSVTTLRGHLVHKTLRYDQKTPNKDSSIVAKLDEALKKVCQKTKNGAEADTAKEVAKALRYLRRVPEEEIEKTLEKIRGGQICGEKQKLESLFLDSLAFIREAGAVKVMVQELISGRAKAGQSALYASAFYLMPRPSIQSVQALKPLFENYQRFPRTTVAAASMVNTYCRQNPRCYDKAQVKDLVHVLISKVSLLCSRLAQEEDREEALVLLKAIGNMGVMTTEAANPLIQCIEKEEADRSIRMEATQAFRNVQCDQEFRQARKQLVSIAVNPAIDTEARIGSYLAAVRCADNEDLWKITSELGKEQNTQVRGFILSHLLNIQESSAPHKEYLKYLLTYIVLPSNFTGDIRKYSQNIDISYYTPVFDVGAGMESNIIYAPGSFLPRSASTNLTVALGKTPFNMGEIGVRFDGLEPILEELLGPEGYIRRTPTGKIFEDLSSSISGKLSKIQEHFKSSLRQRRAIDTSLMSQLFNKLYGDKRYHLPKADIYARMNGQEIAFASLAGDLNSVIVDQLTDRFFNGVDGLIEWAVNINVDSVRTAQVYLDYHLPTIQGFPLKIDLECTAVAGLKLGKKVGGQAEGGPDGVQFQPSLSIQVDGFIGFDLYVAHTGIKTTNHLVTSPNLSFNINHSSGNGFELEVDLPEKMELLKMKSETFLLKGVLGHPDTRVNPSSVRSTRFQAKSCMTRMESALGVNICYAVNLPNVFQSEGLPLGPPSLIKLFLKKSEPGMRGYNIKADIQNTSGKKEIKIEVVTPGSASARRASGLIIYTTEGDASVFSCLLESQSQGGIKVELKNKWTHSEKMFELNTYCSQNRIYSPDTKGIEARFQTNDDEQEIHLDAYLHTANTIREYLDINFEVEGDLRHSGMKIPLPSRLHKFECIVATHRWNVVATIQKASMSQYNSVLKLGQKATEVIDFKGSHIIEGSSHHDLTIKTDIAGKIRSSQYRAQFVLYANDAKTGMTVEIASEGDRAKITELQILHERSGEMRNITFLLGIPGYVNTIVCQASATHQGSSNYQIEVSAKHSGKALIQVEGPVTVHLSSKLTQLHFQLSFVFLYSRPYSVKTAIVFGPQKQLLSFELGNQSEYPTQIEWSMSTHDGQETRMNFRADLPHLIKKSVSVFVSEKTLHLTIDDVLLPKSSAPLKFKGFLDIEFENKKVMCDFTWDSEETQDNKFKADISLVSASSTLQNSFLQGTWTYLENSGIFKTELRLADPYTWFTGFNTVIVDITTSSQRAYHLNAEIQNELTTSTPKVAVKIFWKAPENNVFKFSSKNWIQWLDEPGNVVAVSKSEFTSPEGQQSEILVEVNHLRTGSQREAYVKIQITNPSLQQPVNIKLALDNQPGRYSLSWTLGMSSPLDAAMYELRLAPEGGVEAFRVELKLQEVRELLKSINCLLSSCPPSVYSEPQEAQTTYLFLYERPTSASHSLGIHTPSRKMEGEMKYSQSEISLRFHPRMGLGEPKYELYFSHSEFSWGQPSRLQGRLSIPGLPKELHVDVQYTRDEHVMTGSYELDIFPNAEDKIVGKLVSRVISPETVVVEVMFQGKALKVIPKITVTAAYGPQTIGFDYTFQKTSFSPVSLLISGKLDVSFGRNSACSFIVAADDRKVIDISGSVQPHQSPECSGISVQSKAHSSVTGHYDVSAEWCKPWLISFFSQRHESDHRYKVTLGMESLKRIEISVAESNSETGEQRVLGMSRVKLLSPTVIMIETKYEKDQLLSLKNSLHEKWSRLLSSAGPWLDNMGHEVLRESDAGSPLSQLAKIWHEISNEASRIYEDLEYDGVIPSKLVGLKIFGNIVHGFTTRYRKIWSKYEQAQQQISSILSETIRKLKSEFHDMSQFVTEVVLGGARSLQTGRMPESIHRILSQIEESSLYRDVRRKLDSLLSEHPEEYEGFKQVVEKVQKTLARDLDEQRRHFMSFKNPQQVVSWFVNQLNFEHLVFNNIDQFIKTVIASVFLVPLQMDGNHIKLLLPVHRPVNSLPEALHYLSTSQVPTVDTALWSMDSLMPTPADNLIWAYYSLVPRHARYLFPPYNRTALVVDGTGILTFDGAVLRAPRSPCKVLLVQHKLESLVMQNLQPAYIPHFVLKSSETKVEVKPDFTVTINGQPITGPQRKQGKVEVYKKAEKIEVRTPYITLYVYQRSHTIAVEVSGWTFGQLAGLLGTYDGEMSNDWITPDGSRPSNMQELVKSWQEDQSCQTPGVSPDGLLRAPVTEIAQCNALFSGRSRCNPVIRPDPFLQICYTSEHACHVARAYTALCAIVGVADVFPTGC